MSNSRCKTLREMLAAVSSSTVSRTAGCRSECCDGAWNHMDVERRRRAHAQLAGEFGRGWLSNAMAMSYSQRVHRTRQEQRARCGRATLRFVRWKRAWPSSSWRIWCDSVDCVTCTARQRG